MRSKRAALIVHESPDKPNILILLPQKGNLVDKGNYTLRGEWEY